MVPFEKTELLVSVSFWQAGLVYPGIARHWERRRDLEAPHGIFHSCDFLRFQLADFAGIWISLCSHLLCRIQRRLQYVATSFK
jgi:hypothetical protein